MKLDEAIKKLDAIVYDMDQADALGLLCAYIQASRDLVEAAEGYPGIHALDKALANIKKLEG
jgi:hypothetical protein